MKDIIISGQKIGKSNFPFIIADMSGNHNQSLDRALQIVEAAAKAGVSALKLQTYTADTMTLDVKGGDFEIKEGLWKGDTLYKLYQKAYTPWEWHDAIFRKCNELGLICLSTPFDETAVDFLESLSVPCYKIASFENNHLPLIKKVALTGKPIIISTGMATISELEDAVKVIRQTGNNQIILLKCTSSYPSEPIGANILTIPHMQKLFDCQVGLSDHTLGIGVAVASVVLGATIIEKHFTLSRADGGVDSDFSLEPKEMKNLIIESKRAWQSLGKIHYGLTEKEKKSKKFRRSLYVAKDIRSGETFTKDNLKIVRPGFALNPKYYEKILGRKAKMDLKKGTPVKWELVV